MPSLEMGFLGIRKYLHGLGLPPGYIIMLGAVAVVVLFVAVLFWQRGRNRGHR